MSLARALETGDVAQLPSRRDEDWRWTDLRGLIRQIPPAAPPGRAWGPGLFSQAEADTCVEIINGLGPSELALVGGETVELRFIADGAGSSTTTFRLGVQGAGETVLLETYEGSDDTSIANVALALSVAAGASLERVVICESAAQAVLVSLATVHLAPGARFGQTILTNGARRQRLETQVVHPGGGAQARLDGIYINADQRHSDITTVVSHIGVGGGTDQLIKGVVSDQARAVFQGRIVVERGADQTDAKMGHHALILSDRAEVDAKPELLIFADDVSCAHGNTVGALDEDALFYALQRGIPADQARAMLTTAFVGEVVDRIEHISAREVAMAWVLLRLGVES